METEIITKEQLENLPEEILALFADPKTNTQVLEIGKNYKLNDEQLKTINTETSLLLLGLTDPNEYSNELKNRLKIDIETINNITQKIKLLISNEIIEKLNELYKKREDETLKQKQDFAEGIKGEITLLPKEKQEIINAFGWEKILEEIGKNYNLSDDELSIIKKEIYLILVEFRNKDFLPFSIEEDANIPPETAEKIFKEIDQKILIPMDEKLNENIKKSLPMRSIHWQQNLDFILSGGDYTAFIRRVESSTSSASGTTMADKQNGSATFNPSKLDDLKSKFTI